VLSKRKAVPTSFAVRTESLNIIHVKLRFLKAEVTILDLKMSSVLFLLVCLTTIEEPNDKRQLALHDED
jgi:hypothetical protein